MPNTREMEKLIELLAESEYMSYEKKADHLIANGVTVIDNKEISDEFLENLRNAPITILQEEPTIEAVQEWIPVTERLPENDTYILVTTDGVTASAYWHNDRFYAFTASGVATVGCVTHWMPLPEPPVDMSRMFENVSADDLRAYSEKSQPPKGE